MNFSDEKLRRNAFHEAGHAWMMIKEQLGVVSVSIQADACVRGDNRGMTTPEETMEEGRKDLALSFARSALAGSAAEHFLLGNWDEEGIQAHAFDTGRAKSFIAMSKDDWKPEALDHYVQALANTVLDEISRPRVWNAITGLAYEIMEAGSLSGERVREVLEESRGTG